ncbi:MAG: hypothetical protein ACREDF_12335, partial [Thermoplasmata archaeon]
NYTWSTDGSTWSSPARLDDGTWAAFPILAMDQSNRLHVIWYDGRQSPSGTNTFWYQRSDDRGTSWTMEVPVSQGRYPTGGGTLPTLAVSGDTVIAGWYVFTPQLTMGYAVSPDGGDVWSPEAAAQFGTEASNPYLAADENGTFYAGFFFFNEFAGNYDLGYSIWDGPPRAPTVTGIVRGTGRLTVSWTASPEGDVAGYRLWRSSDGATYELVGTFDPATLSYADTGLVNGEYWYRVTAFDSRGTSSHASPAMSASVGQSLEEMIADLEAQLAALEDSTGAEAADLRQRIAELQSQLNTIQAEKATQAQSFLNTILLVIVILLLVFMFLRSRRNAAIRATAPPQPPASPQWVSPPPSPPSPAAPVPPAQPVEPGLPDEEL